MSGKRGNTAGGAIIHPLALCESADVGEGTRVWAFAHVMPGARIGSRCNLGEGVFVESGVTVGNDVTIKNGVALYDGVTLEDDVFIGPNAVFTNDLRPRSGAHKKSAAKFLATRVARGASIGANATIVCGVTVGSYAMIAAGAVVTHDVPPHALAVGVPARATGWVCACGDKLATKGTVFVCECGRRWTPATNGGLTDAS
ncbi:MAG TPA: acyltransferase [Candidatus Limnocylindrales bacterium]|nr:acyltransferase [Candidatus Limnocylindrales bacterium]